MGQLITHIKAYERGLLFENGGYKKMLKPGRHFTAVNDKTIIRLDTRTPFDVPSHSFNTFFKDAELSKEVEWVHVSQNQLVIHFINDHFEDILTEGQYGFWQTEDRHRFVHIDRTVPQADASLDHALLKRDAFRTWCSSNIIEAHQKGILFYNNQLESILEPGQYFFWIGVVDIKLIKVDIHKPIDFSTAQLNPWAEHSLFVHHIHPVHVGAEELLLHSIDNHFQTVLSEGSYGFWKPVETQRFITINTQTPEVDASIDKALFMHSALANTFTLHEIDAHEKGVLLYNNTFQKILDSGRHFFWKGKTITKVYKVDTRVQQLEVAGQEIMTEDKVPLRINFFCQYQITDVLKPTLEIKNYEEQLYILMQLTLREYIGSLRLDDILKMKKEIAHFVLEKLRAKQEEYGAQFLHAGVKDMILPGEIKDIMNTVLIAEKKAMANVITRREETASTRSLLNTAKLMDENKTLYRLKELEYLEKICDRIGSISLGAGNSLLEQLNALLGSK